MLQTELRTMRLRCLTWAGRQNKSIRRMPEHARDEHAGTYWFFHVRTCGTVSCMTGVCPEQLLLCMQASSGLVCSSATSVPAGSAACTRIHCMPAAVGNVKKHTNLVDRQACARVLQHQPRILQQASPTTSPPRCALLCLSVGCLPAINSGISTGQMA